MVVFIAVPRAEICSSRTEVSVLSKLQVRYWICIWIDIKGRSVKGTTPKSSKLLIFLQEEPMMLGHPNFQKTPKWYGIKNRTVILGWASGSGFLRFGSSFCKILFCDDINTSTLRSNWHSVNGRQRTLSVTGYPEPEHQANPKGYDRTILPVPKATRIFRS